MVLLVLALLFTFLFSLIFFLKYWIDKRAKRSTSLLKQHIPRKVPEADLKTYLRFSGITGTVLSLSIVLVAFEWKSIVQPIPIDVFPENNLFEEIIEIPPTDIPPPKKPIKIQPQIIAKPDDEEIIDDIELRMDPQEVEEGAEVELIIVDEPVEPIEEEAQLIVEEMPEPVGGYSKFYEFLSRKIKYPEKARRMGIEGRVFVEFVVAKNGKITNVKVVKGIGGGCDEEAIRVVKSVPNWNPGKQRGRAVKVRMTVPVYFRLG